LRQVNDAAILFKKDPSVQEKFALGSGSKSRIAAAAAAFPYFLECDLQGEVLWMSDRTRSDLGDAETLSRTMVMGDALCFSRVMRAGGRILMSASPEIHAEPAGAQKFELLTLQGSVLRHYYRLQRAEQSLSRLVRHRKPGGGQAIRQMERERQRLGLELHTGVGQLLAAIRLQLEVIATQLPHPPEPVRQALDRISLLAGDALEQVRSISKRMHPPEWQRLTLENALQQLWEMSGIPQRYAASLALQPLPRQPEQEIKVLLYRAAQEALSNLARHSQATRIEMTLGSDDQHLTLRIVDNGVGFNAAKLGAFSGIGLRSIREQAASIGGKLEIESGAAGTIVSITAPWSLAPDR
jgi:signal transduction histidine kinase